MTEQLALFAISVVPEFQMTCGQCGSFWTEVTPLSWWHRFDRCYACMCHAVGVNRCTTEAEMRPFLRGAAR